MAFDYTEQALSALDRAEHLSKTNPETGLLLAEAQVWATLAVAEHASMSNRMQYAIDFATGDEHCAELGREIGAVLGVKAATVTDPVPEPSDPDWCANCGRNKGHFAHCRAKKVTS